LVRLYHISSLIASGETLCVISKPFTGRHPSEAARRALTFEALPGRRRSAARMRIRSLRPIKTVARIDPGGRFFLF
jgi:hypothetical protein